jgi:hypothetical protein
MFHLRTQTRSLQPKTQVDDGLLWFNDINNERFGISVWIKKFWFFLRGLWNNRTLFLS